MEWLFYSHSNWTLKNASRRKRTHRRLHLYERCNKSVVSIKFTFWFCAFRGCCCLLKLLLLLAVLSCQSGYSAIYVLCNEESDSNLGIWVRVTRVHRMVWLSDCHFWQWLCRYLWLLWARQHAVYATLIFFESNHLIERIFESLSPPLCAESTSIGINERRVAIQRPIEREDHTKCCTSMQAVWQLMEPFPCVQCCHKAWIFPSTFALWPMNASFRYRRRRLNSNFRDIFRASQKFNVQFVSVYDLYHSESPFALSSARPYDLLYRIIDHHVCHTYNSTQRRHFLQCVQKLEIMNERTEYPDRV